MFPFITPSFFKKKKLIVAIFFLFILFTLIIFVPLLFLRTSFHKTSVSVTTQTPKVWQIVLSYNPFTRMLTAKSITIKNGTANPSPFHTSSYKLFVLNKHKQILFQTDIAIALSVLYDIYFPKGTPINTQFFPQPESFDTLVTIPYFADAETIEIRKDNVLLLKIVPPKEFSMSLISQAFASTCNLLHVVFISDGYTDTNKFHADVDRAKNTFLSKAPFSSNQNIFDFQTVDNPISNPLGCVRSGQLNALCIYSSASLTNIANTVYAKLPALPQDGTYTKIVVLVDGAPQAIGGGFLLGVANALGGQFGVFQNRLYFETTATMEVLGHDVGQLYDRYLYPPSSPASQMGGSLPAPFSTNCTTNASGERFWQDVGITGAYRGCTSNYLYAPAPRDCGDGGSSTTIMSAAQCAGGSFDAVEQRYLAAYIIPKYQCAVSPTPTNTPIPTSNPITAGPTGSSQTSLPGFPTPRPITCEPDPSCTSGSNGLQLCPLNCSAK